MEIDNEIRLQIEKRDGAIYFVVSANIIQIAALLTPVDFDNMQGIEY